MTSQQPLHQRTIRSQSCCAQFDSLAQSANGRCKCFTGRFCLLPKAAVGLEAEAELEVASTKGQVKALPASQPLHVFR